MDEIRTQKEISEDRPALDIGAQEIANYASTHRKIEPESSDDESSQDSDDDSEE